VELNGTMTRGMMIIEKRVRTGSEQRPNIRVIQEVDVEEVRAIYDVLFII